MNTFDKTHPKFTSTEKKQLMIFAAIAYGVTFIMGVLLWYGYERNIDTGIIPLAQMFYPAAGVMVAYLLTRKGDKLLPKRFFLSYLIITGIVILAAILSIFLPSDGWKTGLNSILMLGSLLSWLMILLEAGRESRQAYGLNKKNGNTSVFCVVLFIVLYVLRLALIYALQGEILDVKDSFGGVFSFANMLSLFVNFFVAFLPFFGEEYGWRYYLQPLLQKRFGLVKGVLLLGLLWGVWHSPLNFFYYSTPEYGVTSLAGQIITCVTLGIFMAYTYMKTENIWVPVIIHYLNNNMVALAENYTENQKQMLGWQEVAMLLVVNGIIFGCFLASSYFRKQKTKG